MINALSMDGMFVFVIAFFVMVFLVITSMTIKMLKGANGKKKSGNDNTQNNRGRTTNPDEGQKKDSAESEHDEIMKRRIENMQKASGSRQNAFNARKEVKTVDDTSGNVVRSKDICDAAKAPVPHKHPSATPAKGKVRVEKKPLAEGEGDEGCAHNDVRFVLDDVMPKDNSDENVKELQRIVVWNEILSHPKFKK